MKGKPTVSIIMPAYNAERYITQAVESVIAQTFTDWELIVIDDCSTDSTWVVIQQLAETDMRIRSFRMPENSGVAMTRNYGIKQATTDWIAFLDSDDMWESAKLEKQIALRNATPEAALFFTGSAFMDETGARKAYILHVPEKICFSTLLKQNLISCSSVLVRKDYMLMYPMPSAKGMHEDFAVWLQILKDVPFAYGINKPLLIYRLSATSKSGNKLKAAMMNWRTYHFCNVPVVKSFFCMCIYVVRSLRKYSLIKGNR